MVRVRIAPSPTGYLHVGTARTALYNWLFAKKNGGKFILRIEDTDIARSTKEMTDEIIKSLKWLGLTWDEGPYFQSKRLSIYQKYADILLKENKAYYCYCTSEEIAERKKKVMSEKKAWKNARRCLYLSEKEKENFEKENRPKAVRFLVPEGVTEFIDEIHGSIKKDNKDLEDFVLMKSDNTPSYNFAVVIDDMDMHITHVIRGDDHIANTPKQILLYKSLGFQPPKFVHLPLLLAEDKSKLSKRHDAVAVTDYREQGYLKEAFVNFLSLLGWSPGDGREIMSVEELISAFSLNRIIKRGAVFDTKKLMWMNGEYITKMDGEALFKNAVPFLKRDKLLDEKTIEEKREWIINVLLLLKGRVKLLSDFSKLGDYFFTDDFKYDEEGLKKYIDKDRLNKLLSVKERLDRLELFSKEEIEKTVRKFAAESGVKAAFLIHPLRMVVTGNQAGPGLFEVLETLGKEKVVNRIDKFSKIYII